jgi:hypothetical protein
MKKLILAISLLATAAVQSQEAPVKLKFETGQVFSINMDVKTSISQQFAGQSIDLKVDAAALHNYKVTNSTNESSSLHHEVKRATFNFEGLGQKVPFDSDNQKDLDGPFGKPVKEVMSKTYDMVIDPTGKVLMTQPEKIELTEMDERVKIVAAMLKDLFDVVYPPQKGSNSFFKVLPETGATKGATWSETYENESGKFSNQYMLREFTDSTIVVDMTGMSTTMSKVQIMGMEMTTSLNNTTTGVIILDKGTGIVREKTMTTESNGTNEGMGGSTPITSKTTIVTKVSTEK